MSTNPTTTRAIERLWQEIERREGELVETVAELVRHPSPLGQEAEIQGYVAEHLRRSGLDVEVWDLDESLKLLPNAGDSGVPFLGRPNVTGRSAGTGGGRSLILNGHVDVVSPEPVEAWSYDPWLPTIVGDRLYGRGAHDMKSGDALNLMLPRLLRDLGIELQGDLIIHSVIEEECTGNGTLAASLRDQADAAIVTEPTGGALTHAHVGVLWFRVGVTGKSWHAMQAWRGVNAITKAIPIMQALQALDARLNEQTHPAFAGVEHPINLNIGVIQGGDWPSTVPGACELHCRLSCYPGQSVAETRREIEAAIAGAVAGDSWFAEHPVSIVWDGFQSAGSTVSLDEPSVQLLGAWHARVFGAPMGLNAGTGINDMRYYNFAGVPAGCYGTLGGNAHGADEWLDLRSLVPTAKVLGAFILDWCGVSS
ncbi:MAG: ArgE/DapE family deacylase [Thermomicrobiales bacterium]|nr:ArgE/DapE family deacylase [Thermomicrobiales bacterium]